jgi:hypothetical protein
VFLANDELVQKLMYLAGIGEALPVAGAVLFQFFPNDVVTQLDTLVADINAGAGNQLANFVLRLAAKGAV